MIRAQPQTIGTELFKRVHELVLSGKQDIFAIKRLEKDAEKLAEADVVAASFVRSALSALQWDLPNADYWVKNALANDGSARSLLNGAVTYNLLNQHSSVVDCARKVIALTPKNVEYVTEAANHLATTGLLYEAKSALEGLEELDNNGQDLLREATEAVLDLNAAGVMQDRLVQEVSIAFKVAFLNRKRLFGNSHYIDDDCFVMQYHFDGALADEFEIESELSKFLVVDEEWNPFKLSVEFVYSNKNVLHTN